jgi:hypothetical protein
MKIEASSLDAIQPSEIVGYFAIQTESGKQALHQRLTSPITEPEELQQRQSQLRKIQSLCTNTDTYKRVQQLRQTLRDTESDVISVENAGADKRHREYYNQILWPSDSFVASLNHVGWLTEILIFLKTIFLPGLSILMPLFVILGPFILYKFILKQPFGAKDYLDMFQESLRKAVPSVLGKPRFAGVGGWREQGEKIVHVGASIFMFGYSIWNQISAAFHMRTIVADIRDRSKAVIRFTEATLELSRILQVPTQFTPIPTQREMEVFGIAWNRPERITELLKAAGELDMITAVALRKRVCYPSYSSSSFSITDLYHPGIARSKRVYNSLMLHDKRHILLTGPNRGGKSTLLKSVGAAIVMAQTLGIVFARKATFPVFEQMISALTPTDKLGEMSLFEAEIEFAKKVRQTVETTTGPVFLMMDEIFHGTNAHDGVEASQIFLDDLYRTEKPVFSIISTHYMDLPNRYGEKYTENLCMDSSKDPTDPDRLLYTYKLRPGVNQHSSVREILRERGLLRFSA